MVSKYVRGLEILKKWLSDYYENEIVGDIKTEYGN